MLTTLSDKYGGQFEASLVYLLLFDEKFADTTADVIEEDLFQNGIIQEIVRSFVHIRSTSNSIPTFRSVLAHLNDRMAVLKKRNSPRVAALEDAKSRILKMQKRKYPNLADVEYIKQELTKFVTHRSTQIALLESAELLEIGEFDEIQRRIEAATQVGRMKITQPLGLDFTNTNAKLGMYTERISNVLRSPTGIKDIDAHIRGGLEPGRLGIFVAGQGVGKTMAMINAGVCALLQGLNVVHITLEIPTSETAIRYDARLLGFPINEILRNIKRYSKRIRRSSRQLKSKLFIREWGSDEASVMDIRAYLKTLQHKVGFNPQVILVDYADLLCPYRSQREHRFELKDTIRGLRQIAHEFDCAVWTGSQVNKEGQGAMVISMKQLAESSEKANIADVVIGLCQTDQESSHGRIRAILLKNRQGGKRGKVVECLSRTETQSIKQAPFNGATV